MADASKSLLFVIRANVDDFNKSMKSVATTFTQMGTMVAGAAVGIIAALTAISVKSINYADQLVDIAKAVGMTTDEVQKLAFALRLEGINVDVLTSIMKFFSKAMETAATSQRLATEEGKAFNDAFTRLGINLANFRTLTTAQQIDSLFRAIANVADANERADLTTAIFGRSAMDLLPVIQDWAGKQDRLNKLLKDFGIPEDKLTDMAGMKDDIETFKIAIEYIGMKLVSDLMPSLKIILPSLVDLAKKFADIITQNPFAIESLGRLAETFFKIADGIIKVIDGITKFTDLVKKIPHIGPSTEEILAQPPGFTNPFQGHAQGGVFTRPQLALVGEAGPEAVMPLSRLGSMGIGGSMITNHYHFAGFIADQMALRGFVREIEGIQNQERNRSSFKPSQTEFFSQGGHL